MSLDACSRAVLSIFYVLSLALPAYALSTSWWAARTKVKQLDSNDAKKNRIDAAYAEEIQKLEKAMKPLEREGRPENWHVEWKELSSKRSELAGRINEEYRKQGVKTFTLGDHDRQVADVFAGRPREKHLVAGRELVFIGLGAAFATAASIWTLWI